MFVDRIMAARQSDDAISDILMDELRCRGLCEDDAARVTSWYVERVLDEWMRTRGAPS